MHSISYNIKIEDMTVVFTVLSIHGNNCLSFVGTTFRPQRTTK